MKKYDISLIWLSISVIVYCIVVSGWVGYFVYRLLSVDPTP